MPRPPRITLGGVYYHVVNRGNEKARVFHDDHDYRNFMHLLGEACARFRMSIQAFAFIVNHFHLLVLPSGDGDLSRFMHALTTKQASWHRSRHAGSGHVWQGRFKSCPVQSDRYLLAAAAYVDRNAVRAGLVARAERWRWSSAYLHARGRAPRWLLPPLEDVREWIDRLNEEEDASMVRRLRECARTGHPFGSTRWVTESCARHGLPLELRPRGRPPLLRQPPPSRK